MSASTSECRFCLTTDCISERQKNTTDATCNKVKQCMPLLARTGQKEIAIFLTFPSFDKKLNIANASVDSSSKVSLLKLCLTLLASFYATASIKYPPDRHLLRIGSNG